MFRNGFSVLRRTNTTLARNRAAMHYQAIIIGSGQGGGPLGSAFANAGQKTALIEATHVGGTCINEGCTPTKTMVASGRTAYTASRAGSMGVDFERSSIQMDLGKVRQRKRDIVDMFRGGSERRFKSTANLDLIMGKAKFVSSTEVEVTLNESQEVQTLSADKIFINAGCAPSPITIKDADVIEPANLLNSTSIMELEEIPKHLLVLGGGPIGLEFAQLFRRFGSEVSIIQRASHLIPIEDIDVSLEMEKILTEDGINIYLGATSQGFSKNPSGNGVTLQTKTSSEETKSITATHVLNATGRRPNTEALNLEAAGISIDARGFIKVNDYLETTAKNVYALGDIKGGPAFTHISYDDFRILRHNILTHPSSPPMSIANREVPYCVFTDPQLARIGLTETQAKNQYPDPSANGSEPSTSSSTDPKPHSRIKSSTLPMTWIARPLETSEDRGLMKATIDTETGKILGFACIGVEAGEVMTVVQVAMKGGLGWRELRDGVFAHPCLVEGLNNLFGAFGED